MNNLAKDAEILALRHQISILQRQLDPEKAKFTPEDRAFLAALLQPLPREALRRPRLIVRPDTVLRWHRDLMKQRHANASRPKRRRALHPPPRPAPVQEEPVLGLPQEDPFQIDQNDSRPNCSRHPVVADGDLRTCPKTWRRAADLVHVWPTESRLGPPESNRRTPRIENSQYRQTPILALICTSRLAESKGFEPSVTVPRDDSFSRPQDKPDPHALRAADIRLLGRIAAATDPQLVHPR